MLKCGIDRSQWQESDRFIHGFRVRRLASSTSKRVSLFRADIRTIQSSDPGCLTCPSSCSSVPRSRLSVPWDVAINQEPGKKFCRYRE